MHYIGCGDVHRDVALASMGWIVVRFSEKQIVKEPNLCAGFIKYLLAQIDGSLPIQNFCKPTFDRKWTRIEAMKLAAQRYREKLLNHQFGPRPTTSLSKWDVIQTEQEQKAAKEVKPILYQTKQNHNIDLSSTSFEQDRHISFEPKEHIYLYDGKKELQPVSTIVSSYFEPFDSMRWSEYTAIKEGRNQDEVLEDWDAKGMESREIGTFMHAQIEAELNGKQPEITTRFVYDGEFVKIDKSVKIDTEINYFRQFMRDSNITPFRSEWHIFDLNHCVAGTVDLICRNGYAFDLYDWKRSRKATPDQQVWRYGIKGLNNIPDISFYHYALQQNMYKYILEHNYGIKIGKMYIVILHPIYETYLKYEIPELIQEIKIIFEQ